MNYIILTQRINHLLRVFKVFVKSVKLEWCLGQLQQARNIYEQAVKAYPDPKVSFVNIIWRIYHVTGHY